MNNHPKAIVPFLYYVKNGKCLPSNKMPVSAEAFEGWLSATHIIRNQKKHEKRNVKVALDALRKFLKELPDKHEIREEDLLFFI